MAKSQKTQPTIVPSADLSRLRANFKKALTDEAARKRFSVALHVAGGLKQQAYQFNFEASGKGRVRCDTRCVLTNRTGRTGKQTFSDKDFTDLLKQIQKSKVLSLTPETPQFLPDTVVGRLEISDGEVIHRFYFAADEEQAKTQGKVPPKALRDATDAIYKIGERLLKKSTVKP